MWYRGFVFLFTISVVIVVQGQHIKKNHRWKYVGPEEIPPTNADSLQWTSTGTGWIEDIEITEEGWFAGAITGGLYRSKNQGKTWKKIDDDSIQMGTLCLLYRDGILYRGTGLTHYDEKFGLGLEKSTNGGRTWSATGLVFKPNEKQPIWALALNNNKNVFLAASDNSIYRSEDVAATWEKVYTADKPDFRTLLFVKDSVCLAAGNRLLISTDGGVSWRDKTHNLSYYQKRKSSNKAPQRIAITQDPNREQRVLSLYSIGNEVFVDESLDYGITWTNIFKTYKIRRVDVHHAEIGVVPGNSNLVLIGGVRAYISKDGGRSFKQVTYPRHQSSQFAHDDIRGIELRSVNELYLATDGGVFLSTDTGNTWKNVSGKGLNTMQIYGVGSIKNGLAVGCQDLGTFTVGNKGKDWLNLASLYGDGGDILDQDTSFLALMSGTVRLMHYNNLKRDIFIHPPSSSSHFTSWFRYLNHSKDSFFFVGKELWFGSQGKWSNKTKSIPRSEFIITGFDYSPQNPKNMFVAYNQPTWNAQNLFGKFYKTQDGGLNWVDITAKLPILAWRHITSIAINPINENEIWVSLGLYDSEDIHKTYRSVDGGKTWQNTSLGLGRFETFKLQFLPNGNGLVLSALDGMYFYTNTSNKWHKLAGKIPPIAVRDFEIDWEGRWLYAATYGNGLWKMKIPRRYLSNRW